MSIAFSSSAYMLADIVAVVPAVNSVVSTCIVYSFMCSFAVIEMVVSVSLCVSFPSNLNVMLWSPATVGVYAYVIVPSSTFMLVSSSSLSYILIHSALAS